MVMHVQNCFKSYLVVDFKTKHYLNPTLFVLKKVVGKKIGTSLLIQERWCTSLLRQIV